MKKVVRFSPSQVKSGERLTAERVRKFVEENFEEEGQVYGIQH